MTKHKSPELLILYCLSVLLLGPGQLGAYAENSNKQADLTMGDLLILENRYFAHHFGHDPVEKRLERLECLVFGASREGTANERLARLMKTVAQRSSTPLAQEKSLNKQDNTTNSTALKNNSTDSTQYPVLNTLEWKALKKTYSQESLDQRLARLESKLFGQPAQTMAYIDRVERLKKTLGIGLSGNDLGNVATKGPMPKARPRTEIGQEPYFNQAEESVTPGTPFANLPDFPSTPGFGFGFDTTFGANFNKQFQQMFEEMNSHMAQMRALGPGTWVFDQKTNSWVDVNNGRHVKPQLPNSNSINKPKNVLPNLPNGSGLFQAKPLQRSNEPELPPYADPNSI